jgi:hypothetical protein
MAAPRVLYLSSAIGLGHLSKDLAITRELRLLLPEVQLLWLAGHPASEALADAGENVLPEAGRWRGGTEIAERTMRNGQLDLVRYVYRSFPSWAHNMALIKGVVRRYGVDLVVGNEAWEVDVPLILRLLRMPVPFVLITDFVGIDVVGSNLVDRLAAYPLNVLWSFDRTVYVGGKHSAIFIGELDDIPDKPLGWLLRSKREHAAATYDVVGHVVRFKPEDYADKAETRRRLGYDDRPLIVCSVGGTSVGKGLLELCGDAFPLLRQRLPDVRMILVCGPRIPVESVRAPRGVELREYVPALFEHYACCDVAVGQCGASSTTELAALGTPFIYFPIAGHFEQEVVAARLARYGVGRRMSLSETTPAGLAEAILGEYLRARTRRTFPVEGAHEAAQHIAAELG